MPHVPRLALLLAVTTLIACAAHAPTPEYPPLRSVKRALADGEAEIAFTSIHSTFRFEADGTYTTTFRNVYKVLTQGGVENWSGAYARWAPWHQQRPVIRATVTSASGAQSRLEPSALAEAPAYPDAPEIYGDERVLRGPFPNVAIGSVVDEEIVTRTNKPFLGGAEAHQVPFQTGIAREKVELVLDLPDAMPLHYEIHDAKVSVTDVRQSGRRIVTFRGGPFDALKPLESGAPSDIVGWPHVSFTTGTAWKPLAAAYARVVRDKTSDANLQDAVAKVVAPTDNAQVKADKLLAWLRDRVRYVGVEFGESSIIPRTPDETLRHGYGDCKDQAVLLYALMRAAGLSPRVALLDSGVSEDIDARLPALNVFNHAIVVVPGQAPMWIDPTATRARAGELPSGDQGRYALVVDDDSEGLVRTPAPSERQNTYRETRKVFFPDRGAARVVETTTATGGIERGLRDTFDLSPRDKDKWLKDYVAKAYSTKQPARMDLSAVEDLATPLSIVIEAKSTQTSVAGLLSADAAVAPDPIFGYLPRALVEEDERETDLALSMPYEAEIVYEIHPPAGFVLDEKPTLPEITMGPASLRQAIEERADGTVVVNYRFVLPKPRWSAREVNDFRAAYSAYLTARIGQLSFVHPGQKLHKERQYAKEIEAYRRDVNARPDDASAKMRMADALLGLGFGTTARKLADESLKLAPNDDLLWGFAGYIRSRDTLGRSPAPGWDLDGAIAAYREALRIDPTSVYSATQLALLYEYDASGERFGTGAKLDEAVAVLDRVDPSMLASYKDGDFVDRIVFNLMRLGRYDEVRARLAKMDPKKAPPVPAIVAAAMTGATGAGVAEARRLKLTDAIRAESEQNAGEILLGKRNYAEAAALFDEAAQGSSDEQLRHRANVLRAVKKVDVPGLPTAKPEDVVRKAIALCALQPKSLKEDLRPIVSVRDDVLDSKSVFEAFCEGLGVQHGDTPRDAYADLVVSTNEFRAEGSDATGHRVTLTSGTYTTQFFVTREKSGYQLRATAIVPGSLGCEALTQLRGGKKEAAVQWLSWARELVTPSGGNDPLRDQPFLKLWTDKKDEVEVSAAALCATIGQPALTQAPLKSARAKATADRATTLDHALALAVADGKHDAELLAAATQLERAAPTSETAWILKRRALSSLGRFREVRDEAEAWLAKDPSSAARLYGLAIAEAMLGRFKEARAVAERCIAAGKMGASAYNARAWMSLYDGTTSERDVEYALKAVNAAPNEWSLLNTLAAVEIALGRIADAREHFVRSLDVHTGKPLADGDWYVHGRIAEQLGLPDEAKAAYAKVGPPDKSSGQYTTARLTADRIRGLK